LEDSREERKLVVANTIGKVFGIIMVVLYFILGTTFIFFIPEERVPKEYAQPFGVILYIYALFRAYKYYRKFFAD
jgi:hypothetical protein